MGIEGSQVSWQTWSLQQAVYSSLYKIVSPFSEDWPWLGGRGVVEVEMPEASLPGCFSLGWEIHGMYSYE